MTPEAFIDKWRRIELSERAVSQDHFNELCALLGVDKPTDADGSGKWFAFEKAVRGGGKTGGGGFADVWRKNCFVWEYKRRKKPKEAADEKNKGKEGEYKTIAAALAQARDYAALLENPPLVVACDIDQIVVRTLFTGSVSVTHTIKLIDLNDVSARDLLRRCFTDPASLRPEITPQAVTEDAATKLATLAQTLRDRRDSIGQPHDPRRVAHFLNKIVFCLFAEDSGLLPGGVFSAIVEEAQRDHAGLSDMLAVLFDGMRYGKGRFGTTQIPWFNGGLFNDDDVLALQFSEVRILGDAAKLDWASIDPTIFGTLFERGLDPAKRKEMANLFDAAAAKAPRGGITKRGGRSATETALPLRGGANAARRALGKGVGIHYTDPATIMKIVEPVVLRPLVREWEETKGAIAALKTKAAKDQRYLKFRERLAAFRVLDPACGSGNFLYLALRHLKDFDRLVEREARDLGLTADPKGQRVTPHNMLGIEINPYAAELARVTVWIGELQWQLRNGYKVDRRPILGALDGIENRDALLTPETTEARWPSANAIIGNPPFLGASRMISGLGEEYTVRLRATFEDRVPGFADLVCFWFEKSLAALRLGKTDRVGLVATNSIRGGENRDVLEQIHAYGEIFEAWSDEPWILDGAAVRVSLICFTARQGICLQANSLDGREVAKIWPDLSSGTFDLSKSVALNENKGVSFLGIKKGGPFNVDGSKARAWLQAPNNPNGRPNKDVLRPRVTGTSMVKRPFDEWVIDFGVDRSMESASLYEGPFEFALANVKPVRDANRRAVRRQRWWLHSETAPGLRRATERLPRYIGTPRVAKHRLFVWLDPTQLLDDGAVAVARADDQSFGVIHSVFHEIWTLRMCTWLGVGNDPRYTPSTTFETFPFPENLTPNIPANNHALDPRAQSVADAAYRLNELREAWLNPPDLVKRVPEVVPDYPDRLLPINAAADTTLKHRTLTKLYNDRPTWLTLAHRALDRAVAAAYGWPESLADRAQPENPEAADRKAAEEEILRLLFELNQERAEQGR